MPSRLLGAAGGRGWAGGSGRGGVLCFCSPSVLPAALRSGLCWLRTPQELPRPTSRTTNRGAVVFEDPLGVIPSCLTAPRAKGLFFFCCECLLFLFSEVGCWRQNTGTRKGEMKLSLLMVEQPRCLPSRSGSTQGSSEISLPCNFHSFLKDDRR